MQIFLSRCATTDFPLYQDSDNLFSFLSPRRWWPLLFLWQCDSSFDYFIILINTSQWNKYPAAICVCIWIKKLTSLFRHHTAHGRALSCSNGHSKHALCRRRRPDRFNERTILANNIYKIQFHRPSTKLYLVAVLFICRFCRVLDHESCQYSLWYLSNV
jgi:hypothetical protein